MTGHSKWGNIKHRRGARSRQRGPGFREVIHEGYGPGGAAVMLSCATESPERLLAGVRGAFARHGGALGAAGSVAYLFNEVGLLGFPGGGREPIIAAAFEAGAEDVVVDDEDCVEVLTDPRDFDEVRAALARAGLRPDAAGITRRSSVRVRLGDHDAAAMLALLEALENLDDVQDVYSNAEIAADVLARVRHG